MGTLNVKSFNLATRRKEYEKWGNVVIHFLDLQVKVVARLSLMEPRKDSRLKDCLMLVAPVVYVPVMFYLRTFVCCLKEEGRIKAGALDVMNSRGRIGDIVSSFPSVLMDCFHISICSKESRVSVEAKEGEGCISTNEID